MWLRRWVGAAMVALVLVGCSGSGDPEPIPTTPTPTASTPASPSPTPEDTPTGDPTETSEPDEAGGLPPLPDAAKENTPEGAEAFIRYYFDVANGLYMDPKPGVISVLAFEDCQSCASMEAQISDMAAQSQRARTQPYEIRSMARVGGSFDDVTTFNMVMNLPANAILDSNGDATSESGAAEMTGEGAAKWQGDSWVLFGLNLHR